MKLSLIIYSVLIVNLLCNCNHNSGGDLAFDASVSIMPKEAEFSDSIETGIDIPIEFKKAENVQPPKQTLQTEPEIRGSKNNITPILSPGIQLVGKDLKTSIPGRDGIELPSETVPKGLIRTPLFPAPIEAQAPATTDAAYYNLQYLDVDQGLSSSYVMDIMEDSRGNLWISTWATGICVYNSRTFTNYTEEQHLINNYIWTIFEDSKGHIWFGSDGDGASSYDGNQFTEYTSNDGLAGNVVYKILEDARGNIWFATNEGLSKFDGEKFYTYREKSGLSGQTVTDIAMGENNRLLIATENGFSIFDGVVFTHYSEKDGLLSNDITTIFEDTETNIWIGTKEKGICMFDGYTFFSFNTSHGLSGNVITSIFEDDYNRIWIGTENNGLSIYNRATFTKIRWYEGLSSNTVRAFHQDSDLNIWIGTHGGLNKYNERSFNNYTEEQGLGGLIVRGICEDQNGDLWLGHSNGASKYTGHSFENYKEEQGFINGTVRVIKQDYLGNLWFGTDGYGAIYYDGVNFTQYKVENGLSGNTILSMHEDAERHMWFGTYAGGITKFDGESFYHLTMEEGLSSNTIRAITEDTLGNLWFGTNSGGLEKFDGQTIHHFSKKEGLSETTILSLMLDSRGMIWVGTENKGVNIIANETIYHIDTRDGLSNGIIWSIIEDYDHNIWLGTEKGLNLVIFDADMNYSIATYGKLDGLRGTDFYPNSTYLDEENRMWWGTGKALSMLDLNKFQRIKSAPKLSITNVLIDEVNVDYRRLRMLRSENQPYSETGLAEESLEKVKFDSIIKFTNFPTNLEVPYDLNDLTITFSANDWTAPHKIKYMYKLEGASNQWHSLTNDNKVVYSFLPEGNYIFHLKAMGESGLWSETINFKITVKPPWWRTILAYIIYVILLIGLIMLTITLRTKKLIEQRKQLESLVTKRTKEVVKQKEIVELKNKEIIDSINYAKRIQRAILPSIGMVKRKLANAFIYFRPKDIVAGDFYWLEEKEDKILLAVADCTGHGVPGAMVSLVCNNTLSRTVREFSLVDPPLILNMVRDIVIDSFTNSREEVKDGMDIALISLDLKTNILRFSGANSNLYVFSTDELTILKGDRQPIGKYVISNDFSVEEIQLKTGDTFYMFTDGFADQFGGPQGKKFKTTPFIELLESIQHLSMLDQKKYIEAIYKEWTMNHEQVDDICIVGVKL